MFACKQVLGTDLQCGESQLLRPVWPSASVVIVKHKISSSFCTFLKDEQLCLFSSVFVSFSPCSHSWKAFLKLLWCGRAWRSSRVPQADTQCLIAQPSAPPSAPLQPQPGFALLQWPFLAITVQEALRVVLSTSAFFCEPLVTSQPVRGFFFSFGLPVKGFFLSFSF